MKFSEQFIEGLVSLIPQQTFRFIAYPILTVGLLYLSRLLEAE